MFEQFSAEEAAPRRRRLLASLGLSAVGYVAVAAVGLWLFADLAPKVEERVVDVVFAKPPPPQPPPPPPPPVAAPVAEAPPPPPKTSLPKVQPLVAPTEVPQSPPPEATPQPPAAPVDPTPVGAAAGEGENNSDTFGRSGGKEGGTSDKGGGTATGGAPVVLPPGAIEPDCTNGVGQPVYPPMALAAGFEGEVAVKVVVKVDGSVEVVKFIKRDPNFDGAVTDFLKTLRCRAAVYNGNTIAVFKNLRFPFRRRQ